MSTMVVSAFVSIGIDILIKDILNRLSTAIRCKEELESLKRLVLSLQDINLALQSYRLASTSGHLNSSQQLVPLAVNNWLRTLDTLLQQALEMVQQCTYTIPIYDVFSRYKMSRRITHTISGIKEHRENAASIGITLQLLQSLRHLEPFDSNISASSNSVAPLREGLKYIEEPLIVGLDSALGKLEELLLTSARIGVAGMGGVGKTLLMKILFNSHQVKNLFPNGILLWLTISQSPSLKDLRNYLGSQIAFKTNDVFDQMLSEDDIKIWLNKKMCQHKFALFLDDVWERGAELLEGLGVTLPPVYNSNYKSSAIIVSSRNSSTLLQMGIRNSSTVKMQQLIEDDSWQLFLSHAFPYNNGKLPSTIKEETAIGICRECGGLPLALKVTGRAMAGIPSSKGWEITLKKLKNAESITNKDLADSLYSRLRVSYDALARHDISLQLCFLYLAAFVEDKVLITASVSSIWFGEGLLDSHDPFQHGQANVDLLANRCLIEPIQKDIDGHVVSFRVHDVLYTLARQIAQMEENCFFHSSRGLEEFPANECSESVRISLTENKLRFVPNTFRGPHFRSLLLCGNPDLKEIPKQVVGSMTFLRVLDLSNTCITVLPESIGRLKHLVSLNLSSVSITRLPDSITILKNLQMLHLYRSYIRELPSSIHKMSSLRVVDVSFCKKLHSLPYGISQLKSMELLKLRSSPNIWEGSEKNKGRRYSLSINDLGVLKQLKWLQLSNNGKIIEEGTLRSMMQMESLHLDLTKMESLPHDLTSMSRLRKLWLTCPQLIKMEHTLCGFQHLIYIKLMKCYMLKQLPDLHKLVRLKQLDIVRCTNIEKLPKEFGEGGAFPMLETFSLVCLDKLEELPTLEEEAMPSLKVFSLVLCEALQMLPDNYWNLRSLDKIRVYGCSTALKRIQENNLLRSSKVQILTLSAADTIASVKRMETILMKREHWLFGEFWSNELLHFLYKTLYVIFD